MVTTNVLRCSSLLTNLDCEGFLRERERERERDAWCVNIFYAVGAIASLGNGGIVEAIGCQRLWSDGFKTKKN